MYPSQASRATALREHIARKQARRQRIALRQRYATRRFERIMRRRADGWMLGNV